MSWLSRLLNRPSKATESVAPVLFTNTLSGTKDVFTPRKAGTVTMYSCGPTVYSKQHIGNLKAPLFADLVARILMSSGYTVHRVINITDVGHLVSDADEGEDKMQVGATREGLTAEQIAIKYAKMFVEDLGALNVDIDSITFPRATDYIPEQIELVKTLEEKGYTYKTSDGIYFDTAKFAGYGALGSAKDTQTREAAIADLGRRITANKEKHHPADFALWRFSPRTGKRLQEWKSPWGYGFPGWHAECSAMARTLLGQPIDIHTGGIDHIPVHHTNEIAQSEAAYGVPLARFWMHEAFVTVDNEKISKSLGNVIYLSDITERGYHPYALRYFFLQAHYRTPMSFTWDAIKASDEALHRLWKIARDVRAASSEKRTPSDATRRIIALLRDDLATPAALALLWETVRDDELSPAQIWDAIVAADEVLGLRLSDPPPAPAPAALPPDIEEMVEERDRARAARDFARSDELRIHIENRGYRVDDGPSGTVVTPLTR